MEALDDLTVRVIFHDATPYPYSAFVGTSVPIISRDQFADCVGATAAGCEEENFAPLGPGPYRIVEFTPDELATYERNPHYYGEKPYFDKVVLKGGDAQTAGAIDAFTCSVGTGGTLAGVSRYLKQQRRDTRIVLADPHGSALYNWVTTGDAVMTPGPSITEGIGNSRVTDNLAGTEIDDAVQVDDPRMVAMVYAMLRSEGWFFGSSTGINLCAAVEVAKSLGPGHTVVTVLADTGHKYQSSLFNPAFLADRGLAPG